MNNTLRVLIDIILCILPFIFFVYLSGKVNCKKEVRHQQYLLPVLAFAYILVLMLFHNQFKEYINMIVMAIVEGLEQKEQLDQAQQLRDFYEEWGPYLIALVYNTIGMIVFVVAKRITTLTLNFVKVDPKSWIGELKDFVYSYDVKEDRWYIQKQIGHATSYMYTIYMATIALALSAHVSSVVLYKSYYIDAPFYPIFAIIMVGEIYFFLDGQTKEKKYSDISLQSDKSLHIAMYPRLRKPLKDLFGDKVEDDGTTVNYLGVSGGGVEDILVNIEKEGHHIGKNYAKFIRKKMAYGLRPNVDYVRSGYELAMGKSLLFNTPFYDKLNPYAFYAMNRALLTGGKVLVVLGRHGSEDDLYKWCEQGMQEVSNITNYWNIEVLTDVKKDEDELPDIGIMSRSSVHDLDLHKNNLEFLKNVSFVLIVEPSRLVTTAQIGLNLLIKSCGEDNQITFCSVDRNCDGLVDSLSHILMTNITEVAATEYPKGTSSYMYWLDDGDYLQHRILPGISRCLGMGTEISLVALKNQVKKTMWYGGDAFPVLDARWIAKQYYHDLLDYANLPATQETFDHCFEASSNMCDEKVQDFSFVCVEDDRYNLFEIRRNFAAMAEKQGFVNVISSEYMLREYMTSNTEIFTADVKAIAYLTADYARTKRNVILTLCLLLCVDSVFEKHLQRQIMLLNIISDDAVSELWKEICIIFNDRDHADVDEDNNPILKVTRDGKEIRFFKDKTILFKRIYSVESGQFESIYTIENPNFKRMILDDLQNATYVAEQESKDIYIGTELKGHVYQKYMPGQFFTINGKYYEMVSTASDDRILVRRAADHIDGRISYRQVRNYSIENIEDSSSMGEIKSINDIGVHYQFADITVNTPGYWKLRAYNGFDTGKLVTVNGVPTRKYYHKQLLKLDFSKLGDAFTDTIRYTLTNLLNESFVTLFADNQPFICAVTPGQYEAPLTYSLDVEAQQQNDKCIYIIEDSQLDIGLLISVERNLNRIFQIISDYLNWNDEMIEESMKPKEEVEETTKTREFDAYEENEDDKRYKGIKGFFRRIIDWFKKIFSKLFKKKSKKKSKKEQNESESEVEDASTYTTSEPNVEISVESEVEAKEENKTAEVVFEENESVEETSDNQESSDEDKVSIEEVKEEVNEDE